ncbi:MAG: DUF1461 domain-containing protein [archaeon]
MKPSEQKTLTVLATIFLVIIVFAASFFFVFIDKSFYDKSFTKYGAYDKIGVDGVRTTVDYLIKYLTSETTEINEVKELMIFTEKERAHLEDVQHRIVFLKYLGIISAVALTAIIFRIRSKSKHNKDGKGKDSKAFVTTLKRIFLYSGISAITLIALLFLLSLSFPAFFEAFHKVLFPAGNYAFPSDSLLITMFPEKFFQDYARKMLFHSAILSLILLFLSSPSAFAFNDARGHKVRKS